MKHTRSASAVIALLVVLLLTVPTTAAAQSLAVARSLVPATTATWGAVAVAEGAPAIAGASLVVRSSPFSSMSVYADIANLGTVPLSAQSIEVSTVSGWGGSRSPYLTLVACTRGSWNSSGRCTGSQVSLGSTTSGDFTSSVSLKPGERFTVRLTSGWSWVPLVSTIDVSVSRDQASPATVSHR